MDSMNTNMGEHFSLYELHVQKKKKMKKNNFLTTGKSYKFKSIFMSKSCHKLWTHFLYSPFNKI